MEQIENLLERYAQIPLNQYITAAIIFLGFWMIKKIYEKIIYVGIQKTFKKLKSGFGLRTLATFKPTINAIILIIGGYCALTYVFESPLILKITKALIVISIASGFYKMIERESVVYTKIKKVANLRASKILEPFFVKIVRFIIIVITASMVAEIFGYKMDTIIAGLGIGGVAVALAAQDTLSNLIGGIIILIDKPFDIDDFILCDGIEGIVEDISFRSTRIRTFDKELVFIPNAILSKQPITNFSKRNLRRAKFKLGMTYNSNQTALKAFLSEAEAFLHAQEIVEKDSIVVKFEGFSSNSLDILIVYNVETAVYNEFLEIKQLVNLTLLDLVEKHGLEIAYPTTSVYFENALKQE